MFNVYIPVVDELGILFHFLDIYYWDIGVFWVLGFVFLFCLYQKTRDFAEFIGFLWALAQVKPLDLVSM